MGAAVGFLIPPEIVTNGDDLDVTGHQLSIVMYSGAAVTTALFILVVIRMFAFDLRKLNFNPIECNRRPSAAAVNNIILVNA